MRIVELKAYPVSVLVPPEHHHVSLGIGRMIKRDAVEPSVDSFLQRFLMLVWSHSLLRYYEEEKLPKWKRKKPT